MKTLRVIFISAVTLTFAVLIFYAVGNPFDAALTHKSAERKNLSDYAGRMKISGVTYDIETGLYAAQLDDGNGVTSEFIYNPHKNTFTDKYREDQISVVRHTVRGDIIKKVNAHGVYPEEIIVVIECGAGIIGESCDCKLETVYVILEDCNKDKFADQAVNALKGLCESGFETYIIMSGSFTAKFTAGNVSNNRADIAARIKPKEG